VQVTLLFKSYDFKMAEKSISLLEGADEGLFCWFTVNFLHGMHAHSMSYSNNNSNTLTRSLFVSDLFFPLWSILCFTREMIGLLEWYFFITLMPPIAYTWVVHWA